MNDVLLAVVAGASRAERGPTFGGTILETGTQSYRLAHTRSRQATHLTS